MKQTPIVLAYSGGLDTSFCIPYLKETYETEVHAVFVDCKGLQPHEIDALEARALHLGAASFHYEDGFPRLWESVLKWLIRGNVLRDRTYPLSVGSERFVQAELVAKYAESVGSSRIAHGSTGAGNDQVRFDVALKALVHNVDIITPIRDQGLSRTQTTAFLKERGFDVPEKTTTYSINDGIWGTSIGGKETTVPNQALPFHAFPNLKAPHELQDEPEELSIGFEQGLPVSLNGTAMEPKALLEQVRAFGFAHGIGRGMHLGDTIIGLKGRIGFEAPVATILYLAHRELEKLVLTKWQRHYKDQMADVYGMMLHEANFFDPVMRDIEAMMASSQQHVTGEVVLYACRGNLFPKSAQSPYSLMNVHVGTYGEESKGWSGQEARAFTKLYALPTQLIQHVSKQ